MPRLTKAVPKYQKHRASGQAVVRLNGQDFYLGPHGTKASKLEYDRLIAEWLVNGRQSAADDDTLTVSELLARYWTFAKRHYRKDGEPTDTLYQVRVSLRPIRRLYGRTLASEFGPKGLQAVQQAMVTECLSRGVVNKRVGVIKQAFKWGVAQELVPPSVHHGLQAVSGLQKGRTEAPDHAPVEPVPEADIQATLPKLPEVVADMVRFQRLTGCRPGEVFVLRRVDVDRSGDVWVYRPKSHKTEHHDRERIIHIGPKAQAVLAPYLLREADTYCFSPVESERQRRAEQRARRKTKVQPSQVDRRKAKPKRTHRARYDANSYRQAVHRAVELVNRERKKEAAETGEDVDLLERWSPNRLRHSAGTEIRKQFGLEAAQVSLGHAKADVTQVYAERDAELAEEVARKIG